MGLTAEQKMQIAGWVFNLASAIVGAIIVIAKMRGYVTVDEYRAKVAALHTEINTERESRVRAEGDIKALQVEIGYLRGGVR